MNIKGRDAERRLVTVLFAGYRTPSHGIDALKNAKIANVCLEHINRVVLSNGGMIHRHEGDAAMCLFGFPLTYEDAPERAVKTGLELLRAIPDINNTLFEETGISCALELHIGIHSGLAVVEEIGSNEEKEYTVSGDTVYLALKLKDIAPAGEVYVSEQIFKATEYMFEYKEEGPSTFQGIDESFRSYQPVKMRKIAGAKRGIKGLYSPLVGRGGELDAIKKKILELTKGRSGILFITGEAGIGKSRLWQETKNFIDDEKLNLVVLEGQCLYHGEHLSYWPILQMLERIFSINDKDSPETIKDKILDETKNTLPEAWQDVAPYIGHLFSLVFTGELAEKVKYLDPRELSIKTLGSVKTLLEEISRRTPVALVIEDYHWIDSASLALIKFMFGSAEAANIASLMLLCLSREGMGEDFFNLKIKLKETWGDKFTEISLKPLDKYSSLELTYNLLEIPGFSKDFKEKVLSKAEGNPFFLEEIINSLIDSGVLYFEDGMWKQRKRLEEIEIPDTVQLVIAARLDRLADELKNVLQMASVIGRTFNKTILAEMHGDKKRLNEHLKTLEGYEFILQPISSGQPNADVEYTFKHPLIQEVTYASLLETDRKSLHREVASSMEELYKDRVDDFVGLIAQQWAASDDYGKAVEWLLRAGKKARSGYANDDALQYYRNVISIIEENGLNNPQAHIAAYESMGDILKNIGKNAESIDNYSKVFEISKDILTHARLTRKIGDNYQKQSRYDEALAHLNESREKLYELKKTLNPEAPNDKYYLELHTVYHHIAWVNYLVGDFGEAMSFLDKCFGEIPNIHDKKERNLATASALNVLAAIKTRTGRLEETYECYIKAEEIFKGEDDLAGLGSIYNNCVNYFSQKGDYISCIRYLEKSIEIATKIGNALGETIACYNLGHEYLDLGNYEFAKEYFDRYQRINKTINNRLGEGWANEGYSLLYDELGQSARAIECIDTAIGIFRELKSEIKEMSAKLIKADLLIDMQKYPEAQELLAEVEEYAERNSVTGFIVSVHISLGEIYSKTDPKGALREYRKAEGMVKELGWESSLSDIYYHIGEALREQGDKESSRYFEMAREMLMENADKITDESLKRSFLNKPENRKILSA